MRHIFNIRTLLVAFVVGAAVYSFRSGRPRGRFLGAPYDFRVPTPERVLRSVWNEDDERIFMPMPFGVGWTLNFHRVARKFRADDAVAFEEEAEESGEALPPSEPPPGA